MFVFCSSIELHRGKHKDFLLRGLQHLSQTYEVRMIAFSYIEKETQKFTIKFFGSLDPLVIALFLMILRCSLACIVNN